MLDLLIFLLCVFFLVLLAPVFMMILGVVVGVVVVLYEKVFGP